MSSSELETDDEDYFTIDTLSNEDLKAIAANPEYKTLLRELLNDGDHTADPGDRLSDGNASDLDTSTGANTTSRDEEQSYVGADTATSVIQAAHTPNRVSGASDSEPPPSKRRKEGNGDEPSTSGLFDPVLAGTEEDEYQFAPPKMISDYLERHFRRSLTKEERKAMLKVDPKPKHL